MRKRRIFILVGHPDTERLATHLADAYEQGAKEAGHEVRRTNLGTLHFDPILHRGYKEVQPLELDLLRAQEDIRWCEHFVILYPAWFSSMPALLKGFFDRIWLPKFAFSFRYDEVDFRAPCRTVIAKLLRTLRGLGWRRLLRGRSATVFVISDAHPILARLVFGDTTNEIRLGILWFAGFGPICIKKIGPVKFITDAKVQGLSRKFLRWGRKGW